MKWTRYETGFSAIQQGMVITFVFAIFSFLLSQLLLTACFAAVFATLAYQNRYFSKVGQHFTLKVKSKQNRILIGDEEELILEIENGVVPIWNAVLTMSIEDAVLPKEVPLKNYSGIYDLTLPVAVGSNKKIEIKIPLEGKRRGVSRITRVVIEIPHLFGGGFVMMELDEPIYYQSLVYPKITPLDGSLKSSPFKPGEVEQRQSLYRDTFQPVGTRDYVPTDRFDQIHWKASARMQKLQTKEFLPVSSQNVVLMLNVIEKDRKSEDFERKVERLTSYAHFCTSHQIPYSVAINIRTFGATPYIFIPANQGKIHFLKVMETLAQISDKHAKMPFEDVMQSMAAKGQLSPTIVLVSHETNRLNSLCYKWSKQYKVILDHAFEGEEQKWDMTQPQLTKIDSFYPSA